MVQLPTSQWRIIQRVLREQDSFTCRNIADEIESMFRLVESDQHPAGYGTCECCGKVCVAVYEAHGLDGPHVFCRDCCGSGAAIAWMEENEG